MTKFHATWTPMSNEPFWFWLAGSITSQICMVQDTLFQKILVFLLMSPIFLHVARSLDGPNAQR